MYASGFDSPAVLLEDRFDHPVGLIPEAIRNFVLVQKNFAGCASREAS
jgi:hypothetical protein